MSVMYTTLLLVLASTQHEAIHAIIKHLCHVWVKSQEMDSAASAVEPQMKSYIHRL